MANWNSITYERISLPKFPQKSFSTATTVLQNFLGAATHIWDLLWCQAARPGSLFRPAQRAAPNRGREDLGIFHLRDQLRPQKFRGAAQEQQAFTWDQSSGRSDHVSGPYIARDLGKFLCIGQFPAKIKSANEAEYLAQRPALIAQAPGHARLHTITHDLGAPSSVNVYGRREEKSAAQLARSDPQSQTALVERRDIREVGFLVSRSVRLDRS